MNNIKKRLEFIVNMPALFFWSLFFVFTWYFYITKIVSFDLWWHMACGRFFLENGYYPPTGTFTFSPVNINNPNQLTWFGDIVLYAIYLFVGEIGLQLFKTLLALIPVFVIVKLANSRYTPTLLFLAVTLIIGSSQMNLLRNSMFGLIFFPLIVWLWWQVIQTDSVKSYFLLFLMVPLLGLWSIIHGYVIVGTFLVFLIFIGDAIDLLIKKRGDKLAKFSIFLLAVVLVYGTVSVNYSLPVTQTIKQFFQTDSAEKKIESRQETKPSIENQSTEDFSINEKRENGKLSEFIKKKSRFLLKGGDVGFISEYRYPFEFKHLLSVKALILLIVLFLLHLLLLLCHWRTIRFSYILPSSAVMLIGMGYLRTSPFPFVITLPFMVAAFRDMYKGIESNCLKLNKILKSPVIYWIQILTLIVLVYLAGVGYYYLINKKFSFFTGVSFDSPGIGRSVIHDTKIPEYVLEKYPEEKMYNSYNTGSLLIWEWYGKKKVFIDGRSIIYKKDFYNDFRYNYAFGSFQQNDIEYAVLSTLIDYEWVEAYLKQNWNIVCFDVSMLILQRRKSEGYSNFYGNIPEFIGEADTLDLMQVSTKNEFVRFLDITIKYMLIFGRLKDAFVFYNSMDTVIEKLSSFQQNRLVFLKRVMDSVKEEFGEENNTALVGLFKELLLHDTEERKDALIEHEQTQASIYFAFGNAYVELGNMKKAVDFFSAAADSEKANLGLQIKVAELFFKFKALGPAIKHYERAVSLDPSRVHVYNKLGYLYFQKSELKNAEECFKNAVKADPKVIESYINLAAVLIQQKDFKQAILVNKNGLTVDPENEILLQMKKDLGY